MSAVGEVVRKTAYDVLKRSVFLLRVDSGSCNGCDIEVFDVLTPYFDIERFGVKLVQSPRMADVMLVTGPVTRQFRPALKAAYEAMPKPCAVIACGACACGGGMWYDTYGTMGGVDKVIPVDVYIPGCPPRPHAILYGALVALGVLKQKIARFEARMDTATFKPALPELKGVVGSWEAYRMLRLELARHLGYRIGSKVLRDVLPLSAEARNLDELAARAEKLLADKYRDSRVVEGFRAALIKVRETGVVK